jgi:hypothetical protein
MIAANRQARRLGVALLIAALGAGCKKSGPPERAAPAPGADAPSPAPGAATVPKERAWEILASELPSALLSVFGRSAKDVYAVGADKGAGPLVFHFDGKAWSEVHTGERGDLWWGQALPQGDVLMAGSRATVLRYDGKRFERMKTPGTPAQTVYGVWGTSAADFYAVGNASGRDGFVWHFHRGAFETEALPKDLARMAGGEAPGFYKVFGLGDEVWVVGAAGTILHRAARAPFAVVATGTKDTLFTVHGVDGPPRRVIAVGGAGNGVILEGTSGGGFQSASPAGAGLIQGVFAAPHADWASGERGLVFTRPAGAAAFKVVDHGLALPGATSLHSIFVDETGGVWSAGGDVLTTALRDGVLLHYGDTVPPVVIDEEDAGAAPAPR